MESKTYKFFWPNTAATKLASLKNGVDSNYQYNLTAGGDNSPFSEDQDQPISQWGQISDVDPSAGTISIVLTGDGAAALSEKNLSLDGETYSLTEIPLDQFGLWVEDVWTDGLYSPPSGPLELSGLEKIELVE